MITNKIEFVNENLEKFEEHKNYAIHFQNVLASIYENINYINTTNKKAENIRNCGNHLWFRQYKDPSNTLTLDGANFCKHKLCPMCAWRLHIKNSVKFDRVFKALGKGNYYHLVLTIRNLPNITKQFILDLRAKATELLKKKMKLKNYFLSFEMTIDKNGNFHPHYHIIYENDKTFTKKWVQTEWAKICNYGEKYQIISLQKLNGQNVSRELTKYILKFEDIQPNKKQMTIIDNALKGIRKYASNGRFLTTQQEIEKQMEKEEFEKMINLEEYESIISFYKWFGDSYQLEQQQIIPAERKNVV